VKKHQFGLGYWCREGRPFRSVGSAVPFGRRHRAWCSVPLGPWFAPGAYPFGGTATQTPGDHGAGFGGRSVATVVAAPSIVLMQSVGDW
jgi:hypothetical protein